LLLDLIYNFFKEPAISLCGRYVASINISFRISETIGIGFLTVY